VHLRLVWISNRHPKKTAGPSLTQSLLFESSTFSLSLSPPSLERVDINQNNITSVGARAIASALLHNTHLKYLDMGYNDLGDEGVAFIASAIRMNGSTALVDLRLACTGISDRAGKAIAEMLRDNVSLLKMSLSENENLSKPMRNECLVKIARQWKLWNRLTPKHREDYPGPHLCI